MSNFWGSLQGAGINLIITVAIGIINWLLEPLILGIATGVFLGVGVLAIRLAIKRIKKLHDVAEKVRPFTSKYLVHVGHFLLNINNLIVLIAIAFVAIYSGIQYGREYYARSPRYLGGGQPANVILIFNQPGMITTLGLPIPTSEVSASQSQSVKLLMELSDGVLVEDAKTQVPVIIKGDLLYGMIDAAPPTPEVTPTATP